MCGFLGHVVMGSLALRRCIVRIFRYPVRFSCLVVWAFFGGFTVPAPVGFFVTLFPFFPFSFSCFKGSATYRSRGFIISY